MAIFLISFQAQEIPGVKIIRFENSVYFANREYFVNRVYLKARCDPKKLELARKKAQRQKNKALEEVYEAQKDSEKVSFALQPCGPIQLCGIITSCWRTLD